MSKEEYEDFMKTPESQIQAFIAYALTEFINDVLSQSYANVDMLCDLRMLDGIKCKDEFLRKEIKAIAQSIHDSQTSLEFKVSQEIFGKDPVSRFQDILDFWLYHAFANPRDCRTFLKKIHAFGDFSMHDVQVVLKVEDEVSKMSFEDYYRILEYLERFEKDSSIHELSITNSDKYNDDDMPEIAKVDDDFDVDDLLRDLDLD